jgi:hypothetical protein
MDYNNEIIPHQELEEQFFKPKFIPFYPHIQQQYDLSVTETLLFAFIDFYLTSASDKFYFSNDRLGKMFGISGKTIQRNIAKLESLKLIYVWEHYEVGTGTIRFITKEQIVHEMDKLSTYNNKYINNKLLTNKQLTNNVNNKQLIDNSNLTPNTLSPRTRNLTPRVNKHLITEEEIAWLNDLDENTVQELVAKINCTEQQVRDFAVGVAEQCQIKQYKYADYKLVLRNWLRNKYGKRLSEKEEKLKFLEEVRKQYPGITISGGGYDGL